MFNWQITFKDNNAEIKWGHLILEFHIRLPEEIRFEVGLEEFPWIERKS